MIFSISYFLLFLSTCYALTLGIPKATTSYGLHPQGLTPRPTRAPEYNIIGRDEMVETLIWAPDNTCGYLSGIESTESKCPGTAIHELTKALLGSSYTCGGGRCAYLLSSSKSWGNIECCSTGPCTGTRSMWLCVNCDFPNLACIDSVNYYTYGNCDPACQIDSYTLKW